jgi:hypothetical protein
LWKYPSGKGPEEDLQKPFNVNDYLTQELPEGEEGEEMSDEEIDNLMNEVLEEEEE